MVQLRGYHVHKGHLPVFSEPKKKTSFHLYKNDDQLLVT